MTVYSATGLDIGQILLGGPAPALCDTHLRGARANQVHQLLVRRDVSSASTEKLYWPNSIDGEAHVFHHLAVAQLDHDEHAGSIGCPFKCYFREGIKRDGPKHAHANSFGARLGSDRFQDAPQD